MTDSLSKPVAVSALVHIAIATALLVKAYMAPSEIIDLRNAMRVDIVGLPEKSQTLPEQPPAPVPTAPPPQAAKPIPKPPPAKPKAPEPPKVDLSRRKKEIAKSQKKALDEIKALSALDKIKNEVTSNKIKAAAKPVKGNVVNAGNALSGLEKIEFDRYFQTVEDRVRQNWSLPQWLADSPLRAQALVLIDDGGAVKKKQLLRSSGNPEFDERVFDAIDKSAPFPAPPDRLKSILSNKGIVFNFPQRGDS